MKAAIREDIPEIAAFMSDLWEYTKKYWNAENTDEYAVDMYKASNALCNKYHHPFVSNVIVYGCMKYFSDKSGGRCE